MVASRPKLVFDQMAAPVPEIMDALRYFEQGFVSVTNRFDVNVKKLQRK
jgi:hypothetical protein